MSRSDNVVSKRVHHSVPAVELLKQEGRVCYSFVEAVAWPSMAKPNGRLLHTCKQHYSVGISGCVIVPDRSQPQLCNTQMHY